jgi:hypothetical protein
MNYYRSFDQEESVDLVSCDAPASRYAWLEHEQGMWHLLTDLFAYPEDSTRRWSDSQHALDELIKEGWTIVSSYPEDSTVVRPSCDGAWGYGLMWVGH